VGYIDCGTYDRWTTWEGGPGGRGVIGVIDLPAGSISYVVDPVLRRRGYCAAMVTAVLAMPELAAIEMFAAGAAPANAGSVGCLRKGDRVLGSRALPGQCGPVAPLHPGAGMTTPAPTSR
jgi:hypothetical protein